MSSSFSTFSCKDIRWLPFLHRAIMIYKQNKRTHNWFVSKCQKTFLVECVFAMNPAPSIILRHQLATLRSLVYCVCAEKEQSQRGKTLTGKNKIYKMLFALSTKPGFSLLTDHTGSRRLSMPDSWAPEASFCFPSKTFRARIMLSCPCAVIQFGTLNSTLQIWTDYLRYPVWVKSPQEVI